jgi:hypothetical protein
MRSILLIAYFSIVLAGCGAIDSMTDGFKHAQEVSEDLEKSVGTKPFVGFNWSNGSLVNVTVAFEGVPPGKSAEQIGQLARESISTRFQQTPKQVVLSFTFTSD